MAKPINSESIAGIPETEPVVRRYPLFKARPIFYALLLVVLGLVFRYIQMHQYRSEEIVRAAAVGIAGCILAYIVSPVFYYQYILTTHRFIIARQRHWLFWHQCSARDLRLSEIVGAEYRHRRSFWGERPLLLLILDNGEIFNFALDEWGLLCETLTSRFHGVAQLLLLPILLPVYLILLPALILMFLVRLIQQLLRWRRLQSVDIAEGVYSAILEAQSHTHPPFPISPSVE